jgi:hypothetical protein
MAVLTAAWMVSLMADGMVDKMVELVAVTKVPMWAVPWGDYLASTKVLLMVVSMAASKVVSKVVWMVS